MSALENRQGLKIACLEEIALNYSWIKKEKLKEAINFYGNCMYSNYLKNLLNNMIKKIIVTGGNGRFAQELRKIKTRYKFIFRIKNSIYFQLNL